MILITYRLENRTFFGNYRRIVAAKIPRKLAEKRRPGDVQTKFISDFIFLPVDWLLQLTLKTVDDRQREIWRKTPNITPIIDQCVEHFFGHWIFTHYDRDIVPFGSDGCLPAVESSKDQVVNDEPRVP